MSKEMTGTVALVTGGTRGIGFAVAEALLDEGASVFISGRSESAVKSAVARLAEGGRNDRVDGSAVDVRRYEDCRKAVARAAERFGGLDILVNSHARRMGRHDRDEPVGCILLQS
jgi:NAD(P)-dependent dehydrogenase (short-subunit alcohol dehydrogenase family)